jgi:hypothetical protein
LFSEFDRHLGIAVPTTTVAVTESQTETAAPEELVPIAAPVLDRRRRLADRRAGQVLRVPIDRLNELVRVISDRRLNSITWR